MSLKFCEAATMVTYETDRDKIDSSKLKKEMIDLNDPLGMPIDHPISKH